MTEARLTFHGRRGQADGYCSCGERLGTYVEKPGAAEPPYFFPRAGYVPISTGADEYEYAARRRRGPTRTEEYAFAPRGKGRPAALAFPEDQDVLGLAAPPVRLDVHRVVVMRCRKCPRRSFVRATAAARAVEARPM
jgi:hypothetical protein